jgi:two-component system response regulator PilR (NtrC family)
MKYTWKGNVRELENIVERVTLLCDKELITPDDLPDEIKRSTADLKVLPEIEDEGFDLERVIEKIEKDYLVKALERSGGVKMEAAKLLSLSFRSFRHRLSKYGIK